MHPNTHSQRSAHQHSKWRKKIYLCQSLRSPIPFNATSKWIERKERKKWKKNDKIFVHKSDCVFCLHSFACGGAMLAVCECKSAPALIHQCMLDAVAIECGVRAAQHMEIVILFRKFSLNKLTSLFTCILRHQMMRWHSTISSPFEYFFFLPRFLFFNLPFFLTVTVVSSWDRSCRSRFSRVTWFVQKKLLILLICDGIWRESIFQLPTEEQKWYRQLQCQPYSTWFYLEIMYTSCYGHHSSHVARCFVRFNLAARNHEMARDLSILYILITFVCKLSPI